MIPETIAHYRVLAKIGEGGMGEVYRAVDTKLDREVALKILPASFAQDPDRMARFEREAKVLASLNGLALGPGLNFDVSRDGRVLTPNQIEDSEATPIDVVINWASGLKR